MNPSHRRKQRALHRFNVSSICVSRLNEKQTNKKINQAIPNAKPKSGPTSNLFGQTKKKKTKKNSNSIRPMIFSLEIISLEQMLFSIRRRYGISDNFSATTCTFEQYCLTVKCDINYKPYFKVEKLQTKRTKEKQVKQKIF